ncbi:hydroxyisourate hydrolase [Kitasatospora sp. NPDC052896]|uniref:hydroxyisourate hydrolase n=1 Tax=Kitasatospora sp. NPDC052896 TaxID=3364061 RepID=UPI0037C95444
MSVSVHVIDASLGMPAANLRVRLRGRTDLAWEDLAHSSTDHLGRLAHWHPAGLTRGTYQLVLDLDGYFAELGAAPLYPRAIVEFRLSDPSTDLHLPMMITPTSYLTYRGT